jgi:hypothetical protein
MEELLKTIEMITQALVLQDKNIKLLTDRVKELEKQIKNK